MCFLFRLNLNLHAGVGKKNWNLEFCIKHGLDSLSFTLSAHVRSVITQPFDSRVTASSDNWFEAVARLLTDYLDTRQTMNRYKKNNTVNM